mmetsp:Transcript_14844/g.40488  ORF Transcript_14844/g.40488 Transcript_14844/m.40488 type:complete len:275 (-) Transcript_14844:2112-2936(-)
MHPHPNKRGPARAAHADGDGGQHRPPRAHARVRLLHRALQGTNLRQGGHHPVRQDWHPHLGQARGHGHRDPFRKRQVHGTHFVPRGDEVRVTRPRRLPLAGAGGRQNVRGPAGTGGAHGGQVEVRPAVADGASHRELPGPAEGQSSGGGEGQTRGDNRQAPDEPTPHRPAGARAQAPQAHVARHTFRQDTRSQPLQQRAAAHVHRRRRVSNRRGEGGELGADEGLPRDGRDSVGGETYGLRRRLPQARGGRHAHHRARAPVPHRRREREASRRA